MIVDLCGLILTNPLKIMWLVDYGHQTISCYSALGKRPAIDVLNELGLQGHIEEIVTDPNPALVDHKQLNRTILLAQHRQVKKVLRL